MVMCSNCSKKLSKITQSTLCRECYLEIKRAETINHWLTTGDTGCQPGTTLRNAIRDYILEAQNNQCAICNVPNSWAGKPLKFILDHIDGNAANNHPSNLRLICPNCDSQLPTYKSKNKQSARTYRKKYYTEQYPSG